MLDSRQEHDPPFINYHIDDMICKLKLWTTPSEPSTQAPHLSTTATTTTTAATFTPFPSQSETKHDAIIEVMVPGRREATMGALRRTIANTYRISMDMFYIIYDGGDSNSIDSLVLLSPAMDEEDLSLNSKILQISPGATTIIVEIINNGKIFI